MQEKDSGVVTIVEDFGTSATGDTEPSKVIKDKDKKEKGKEKERKEKPR